MANPRLNSLDEYEQLKRKNRRRLVGASAMVVLAGILLARAAAGTDGLRKWADIPRP